MSRKFKQTISSKFNIHRQCSCATQTQFCVSIGTNTLFHQTWLIDGGYSSIDSASSLSSINSTFSASNSSVNIIFWGIKTFFEESLKKQYFPSILSTVKGISMRFRLSQYAKASSCIIFKPSGKNSYRADHVLGER